MVAPTTPIMTPPTTLPQDVLVPPPALALSLGASVVAPILMVPVEEPVLAPDLLALVSRIPASVCKLVEEKEVTTSRCAKLEKQLAEERETGRLLQ